ncbi:aspartyl protease family protein [Oxalobacteraceae bacterium A2-2]
MRRALAGCALLLAAVLPWAARAQQGGCAYTKVGELPLQYQQGGLARAQGAINGAPVSMALDTGAYKTFLLRSTVEKLGISLGRANERTSGVGGTIFTASAKIKEFTLGEVRTSNAEFPVLDALDKADFGVILGADFLLQADLEFSLAERKAKFFRAHGCDDKGLGYWAADVMDVPLRGEAGENRPIIEVLLNGRKVLALLDTGSASSGVDAALAEELGVAPAAGARTYNAVGVGDARREVRFAEFATLQIGDELIKAPSLGINSGPAFSEHRMIIGLDYLRSHHILISRSQHRLYYSYTGGPVFERPEQR